MNGGAAPLGIDLEAALARHLPAAPPRLAEAMRYAVLGAGRRLRPRLRLGAARWVGGAVEGLEPAACAVEYVHAYSLAHDDLPAMDDDDLRRGRPSLHRAFDEATAILAGDGLQAAAFALLAGPELVRRCGGARCLEAVGRLARAAGPGGMVGGQVLDLAAAAPAGPRPVLRLMGKKTAALFSASAAIGAVLGGGEPPAVTRMATFGRRFGLLYQILDDLADLDRDRAAANLGGVLGREEARRWAERVADRARATLDGAPGDPQPLAALLAEVWPLRATA